MGLGICCCDTNVVWIVEFFRENLEPDANSTLHTRRVMLERDTTVEPDEYRYWRTDNAFYFFNAHGPPQLTQYHFAVRQKKDDKADLRVIIVESGGFNVPYPSECPKIDLQDEDRNWFEEDGLATFLYEWDNDNQEWSNLKPDSTDNLIGAWGYQPSNGYKIYAPHLDEPPANYDVPRKDNDEEGQAKVKLDVDAGGEMNVWLPYQSKTVLGHYEAWTYYKQDQVTTRVNPEDPESPIASEVTDEWTLTQEYSDTEETPFRAVFKHYRKYDFPTTGRAEQYEHVSSWIPELERWAPMSRNKRTSQAQFTDNACDPCRTFTGDNPNNGACVRVCGTECGWDISNAIINWDDGSQTLGRIQQITIETT